MRNLTHFDSNRRSMLKKWIGSAGFLGAGVVVWSAFLKGEKQSFVLRPPSAQEDFLSKCVRCGLCVEACPYLTLKLATLGSGVSAGTPYFEPRKIPCYMCKDVPCAKVCPSGALDIQRLNHNIDEARMGVAVVDQAHCIAYGGIQCDACYRACPLIDKAIKLEYRHSNFTKAHTEPLPIVDANVCTGCGKCERACVTKKPTIVVMPREMVLGEVGEHYIRSWKEDDENRIQSDADFGIPRKDALDYLNNGGF